MASPELQSKLQRRLFLQKEDATPTFISRPALISRPAFGYQAISGAAFCGHRHLGEAVSKAPPSHSYGTVLSRDEAELQERINMTAMECKEARQQKQSIEAVAVSRGIEIGSEVARLRIDVEVLRRELDTAKGEVYFLRKGAVAEERKGRRKQDVARRSSLEVAAAQIRREELSVEVQDYSEEKEEMESQVCQLEDEVQNHVLCRVRLEALLRASEVRENELRRLMVATEASTEKGKSLKRQTSAPAENFSLDMADSGDETEEDEIGLHDTSCTDLEFSYEGLELPGIMSLERALQLARCGTGGGKPGLHDSPGPSTASTEEAASPSHLSSAHSSAAWPATLAEESQYEAPLRELEFALSRLRSVNGVMDAGAHSIHRGSPGPDEHVQAVIGRASAGTGGTAEADLGVFEDQVNQLQQALNRIQAASATPAERCRDAAAAPGEAAVADDVAAAPELAAGEKASSSPTMLAETAAAPATRLPAFALGGLGGLLLSPYARLGEKYGIAGRANASSSTP